MKKLLLLAIVVLGFSAVSFGQTGSTISDAKASATVLKVLTIEKVSGKDLNFGVFAAKTDGTSTVTLSQGGTLGGSAMRYESIGAPASTAEFLITGTPLASFTVILPSKITIKNTVVSGAVDMDITNLVTDLGEGGETARVDNLSADTGLKTFHVGGTLNVGQGQAAGTYTGTYEVKVNYN